MLPFLNYDTLWIESIPSIATIFYHKYLSDTHILYCPDEASSPNTPRQISQGIRGLLNNSNNIKVAIYFLNPCSEQKKATIISITLKYLPNLSSYSLSLPTTVFQTNLLLGWSAEISDPVWQRRCKVPFDPEAFYSFEPQTEISGQSDNFEFLRGFAISRKKFSKKSLIVDLSSDMITFDIGRGIQFKNDVDKSIKGWMRAADGTPRTLIWIIDERSLYGDIISLVVQDQRVSTLKRFRNKLFSSIEAFASTTPIYCYLINTFSITPFQLSNYLAQIQHRHHLCLAKTILLKRHSDEEFGSSYLSKIKTVHLDAFPIHNQSKWESIYLKYFNEMKYNGYDDIRYISPEILNVDDSPDNYNIPLLTEDRQRDSLTISESIGIDDNLHTVSAQSYEVFDKWTALIQEASVADEDAGAVTIENQSNSDTEPVTLSESITENESINKNEPITKSEPAIENESILTESTPLFDRIVSSLTTDMIKNYINDDGVFEQGMNILSTLFGTEYSTWKDKKLVLSAKANGRSNKVYIISITIDQHTVIKSAICTCLTGASGHCRHCAATLVNLLQNPNIFSPFSDCDLSSSGSDTSSAKKRSLEESQGEDTDETGYKKPEKKGKCREDTVPDDRKDQKSDNTSSINSNSVSTLPSIPSTVYTSSSSKSFQSILSFPTLSSSGSLEAKNNSSGSSGPPSLNYSTLPLSSVGESFTTQEYSADDEAEPSISHERRESHYVTAQGTLENATQYYDPNDDEADNAVIDLDVSSDEEDLTQPYDANEMPTQPYNPEAKEDDNDQATQPYSSLGSDTQYHHFEGVANSFNETASTQPFDSETAPTQPYESAPTQVSDFHTAEDTTQNNQNDNVSIALAPEENDKGAGAYEFDTVRDDDEWSHSESNSLTDPNSAKEWLSDLI